MANTTWKLQLPMKASSGQAAGAGMVVHGTVLGSRVCTAGCLRRASKVPFVPLHFVSADNPIGIESPDAPGEHRRTIEE